MIRQATLQDIPTLVELARMEVAESRFRDFGFVLEKVTSSFTALIEGTGVAFIAERDGEVIGGIVCGRGEDWFSNVPMTFDFGIMVKPEYRGGLAGAMLMRAYSKWADSLGPVINKNAGITTGIGDMNRIAELWQRTAGLKVIGVLLSNMG